MQRYVFIFCWLLFSGLCAKANSHCDTTIVKKSRNKSIQKKYDSNCRIHMKIVTITHRHQVRIMHYQNRWIMGGRHFSKSKEKLWNTQGKKTTVIKSRAVSDGEERYIKTITITLRENEKKCRKRKVEYGGRNYFP